MLTSIFYRFLIDFCSQLGPPEPQKSLKFYLFYSIFCKIGLPKLTSIFDPILVPTWLHFGSQNSPKSRLGGLLGRLESVLGRLSRILERLGGVLERLGGVLGRLGASWSVLGRLSEA